MSLSNEDKITQFNTRQIYKGFMVDTMALPLLWFLSVSINTVMSHTHTSFIYYGCYIILATASVVKQNTYKKKDNENTGAWLCNMCVHIGKNYVTYGKTCVIWTSSTGYNSYTPTLGNHSTAVYTATTFLSPTYFHPSVFCNWDNFCQK